MSLTNDETNQRLIKAIQQGSRDAFAQFYDLHHGWLMAVAFRILQNQRDAEDLLHDVFIEIWSKAASYNPQRGTVFSWLAVKIRSRALDRLRALKTFNKHISEGAVHDMIADDSSQEASQKVEHIQAVNMLEQLSPVQRTVIELSYFRGMTCQEIANHCQMPLGSVKSSLLRGIKTLRLKYAHCEVTETCQ